MRQLSKPHNYQITLSLTADCGSFVARNEWSPGALE